jgi:16S rRNA (guanine966-N2)-methyltransferase
MRIIAGKAGRTVIKVPSAVARPTTDFVRQALFSILGQQTDGARVLDLYSGSGALGLEALSRGAASCTFVDEHRQAATVVTENLAKAKLTGGHPVKSDVISYLTRDSGTYDLIFADPPYWKYYGDKDHVTDLFKSNLLPPRLAQGGRFIVEISSRQDSPIAPEFSLISRREYGSSTILLYEAASPT